MEFFDTHVHLNDEMLAPIAEEVVKRAADAGVKTMTVNGYDRRSSLYAVHIAERYPNVYAAVGIHPHDSDQLDDATCEQIAEWVQSPKVVAIGEIGLDYYRDLSPRELQKKTFIRQIDLARELKMPITVHIRDAYGDSLDILKKHKGGANGGIIHCFSGSWECAEQALDMGFHISFAGPVTYPNAVKLQQVAAKVPLDRLLIETDCPYLTPQAKRGKTNEPANVVYVAEKIAELRDMDIKELAAITTANAKNVYRIAK